MTDLLIKTIPSDNYQVRQKTRGWWDVVIDSAALPYTAYSLFDLSELHPYRIDFNAGYTTLPAPLRTGILRLVTAIYENRGDCECDESGNAIIPASVRQVINPYCVRRTFLMALCEKKRFKKKKLCRGDLRHRIDILQASNRPAGIDEIGGDNDFVVVRSAFAAIQTTQTMAAGSQRFNDVNESDRPTHNFFVQWEFR